MRIANQLGLIMTLAASVLGQARVGTFDRQPVVVAYYRSPQWASVLHAKNAERDAARKAGDTQKVQELNTWGGAQQNLAHRQLMGQAPIDNIVEALQPAFVEIARKQKLDKVVETPAADERGEMVDVTDSILDWLKADDPTRAIIHELRNKSGK